MTISSRCPSDLALEQHLLRADPRISLHVRDCPRCTRWMEAAQKAGDEFEANGRPLIARALASVPERQSRLGFLIPALTVSAVAMSALLLLWHRQDPVPALAVKGSELTLFVRKGEQVVAVADGQQVRAGDALRFFVAPESSCFVWVVSLDARGQLSRLAPADGDLPLRVEKPMLLPGGAVLDETAGPERFYALMSDTPVPWSAVERAFAEATGQERGEALVRSGPVPSLRGVRQATLVLEREAP